MTKKTKMKTVTFQLIGEYIDQIKAGSKVAEYRHLSEYNTKRLCYLSDEKELEKGEMYVQHENEIWRIKKDLTHVQFFNGYRKNRKELLCELKAIDIKENPEGDTPGVSLFVISLGRIVSAKNF
jgi:hypothetical protein